jgi:hypothetical protein
MLAMFGVVACGGGSGADPAVDAGSDALVDAGLQSDADAAVDPVPPCEDTIVALIPGALTAASGPDSNGFVPPDAQSTAGLRTAIGQLLDGEDQAVFTAVNEAGYHVCRDGDAVLLRPLVPVIGQAWIVLRPGVARPILVGLPHVSFELRTLDEGLLAWTQLNARALVVAGTHRCANPVASGCSGTTGVCSASSAPYRESDMAHTEGSFFHAAHEALQAAEPTLVVLSLHGMSGSGISLSNGTSDPVATTTLLAATAQALATALPAENVTACNAGAGVPRDVRLCGTTNTQGRLVNGSGAPCTQAATASTDRFLHLEQSLTVRNNAQTVIDALDAVLP